LIEQQDRAQHALQDELVRRIQRARVRPPRDLVGMPATRRRGLHRGGLARVRARARARARAGVGVGIRVRELHRGGLQHAVVGEAAQDERLGLAAVRRRALESDRLEPEAEPDRTVAPQQAEQAVPQPHVRCQVEWRTHAQEVVLDLLRYLEEERPKLGPAEQHGHARTQHGLLPLLLDSVQRRRRLHRAYGV
jgi:hypothetical protein